jgi:osmoprotectant transport system ATP-binding protein
MIELRAVSKSFGGRVAVHPTDVVIEEGKTTALIGPSGCGKSTLLRLIVGLIQASSGSVLINGQPLTSSNAEATRQQIGFVVQDGGLFPHLTARQNVTLMARHLRKPVAEVDQRLSELATLTHFPLDALDRFPGEISGGQRQRVSLMRALMLNPSVLLLDEPLGALDPMVRASLQTDLKRIFQQLNQTVLFVTHDMGEAGYLGDTIILMNEGRIVQRGSLEDLRDRPSTPFVTDFLNAQRSLVAL